MYTEAEPLLSIQSQSASDWEMIAGKFLLKMCNEANLECI